MTLQDLYLQNKELYNVFCEVGVHFWKDCRLVNQINDNKKVILVEPLLRCVEDIYINIKNKKSAILHPVAVTEKIGSTVIFDEGPSAFINEVRGKAPCHQNKYYDVPNSRQISQNEIQRVPTVSFDVLDPGNIDMLLIDTEGAEFFVLKNLISRPKIISVETHYANYKNPFYDQIIEWMNFNNYEIWYKTESDTIFIKK